MELQRKTKLNFEELTMPEREQFLNAMMECFPTDKSDNSYINYGLKQDLLDLYYNEKGNLVGFLTYELDSLRSYVSRLGVVGERNKGIATTILKNHINENANREIHLTCVENNPARYIYHENEFLVVDITEVDSDKYIDFIHYPQNEIENAARVLNETYKYKKLFNNRNLEYVLSKMYENKFYDNLYQYDLNDKQIDKIIQNSALFAQGLSLLDYAEPRYHAHYNYNVRKNNDDLFFYYIQDNAIKSFVEEKLKVEDSLKNKTIRELYNLVERIIVHNKDSKLSKGLKDAEIEKE